MIEDSREQLEADIEEWASIMDLEDQIDTIHGWLNRRAAILEREMVKFNRRYFDCVEQEKKIAELTRKMEILKAHGVEIVDAVAGGYEVYNEKIREVFELQAKVDELTAERDNLKANNEQLHTLAGEQAAKIDELTQKINELTQLAEAKRVSLADRIRFVDRIDELEASNKTLRELVIVQSKAVFDLASNSKHKDI